MRLVAAALALALVATARAEVAVPPVARVTDQTATLGAAERGALEQRLAAFEQRKGSQIAVLIVPTTRPETIEQYSIRVAEAWKLGRKGVDDGLLLLVAKDDREVRAEVGYGLEGAVPDAIANRVIDEIIVPRFRAGDFYGGISAGVDQLMHVIDGEPLPEPKRALDLESRVSILLPLAIAVLIGSQVLGAMVGEVPSSLVGGGLYGALTWFVLGIAGIAGVFGLVMFVFLLLSQLGRGSGGASGGRRHGGWGHGGFGSSGGGFSGGGGGFSGGGGGFGGGGASGRW